MFWLNMGPRGRKFGHRGFRPDLIVGLIALLFGGWIVIAVLGGLLGAGIMILGSVFSALAHFASRVFSGIFSSESIAVGLAIGLIFAYRNRRRTTEEADGEENCEKSEAGSADPENAEITEPQIYHTFSA